MRTMFYMGLNCHPFIGFFLCLEMGCFHISQVGIEPTILQFQPSVEIAGIHHCTCISLVFLCLPTGF